MGDTSIKRAITCCRNVPMQPVQVGIVGGEADVEMRCPVHFEGVRPVATRHLYRHSETMCGSITPTRFGWCWEVRIADHLLPPGITKDAVGGWCFTARRALRNIDQIMDRSFTPAAALNASTYRTEEGTHHG